MVRSVILKHYQESLRESLKSQRKSQVSSHEAALVRFQNFLLDHMVVVLISIGIYQLFELRSLVVGSWLSCAVGFTKWSVESGQSTSVIFTRCCGEYKIAHRSDTILVGCNNFLWGDWAFEFLGMNWTVFWKVLSNKRSLANNHPVLHGNFPM